VSKRIYEIDGYSIATLEEFYDAISRALIPGVTWGRNLDAFNDILRGGFGTPDDGFVLRWSNHHISQERLGYAETPRQLELKLERCHPTHRDECRAQLAAARARRGPTVFDWLVEIIEVHGPGGGEAEDAVEVVLA
jgi:RNAse (barnase) inhibitor barstar